jgi:hypothetical protein
MPALSNIVWNVGITKMSSTATAPTATVRMTLGIDHGALDLALERVGLLEEDGQAQQDRVQDTAGLTGGDHVHVERREHLLVLAHRVGQGLAGLDVVEHLLDDLAQRLVLALLREDVEALHERQAGVDHGRELAREDDDVARRDAAAELGDRTSSASPRS